ncbi:hypothetical protein BDY24DRAFT_379741, partial [Mrakia frigida]|uniref:uncharacterized protein n=1 Tax=Mrakia frigida TaxID=29902 RepID=UPI003FCC1DD9
SVACVALLLGATSCSVRPAQTSILPLRSRLISETLSPIARTLAISATRSAASPPISLSSLRLSASKPPSRLSLSTLKVSVRVATTGSRPSSLV